MSGEKCLPKNILLILVIFRLGAAHNICNLRRSEQEKIVGFAHNFSGYDSHLLVKAIDDYQKVTGKKLKLNAIPLNQEKFKMLKINDCVLLDSLAFLNSSLDKLVDTLKSSNHDFPILRQWIKDDCQRELMLRKGVYPYEYVTSLEKVRNTVQLPSKNSFFSLLQNKGIDQKEYDHAIRVWKEFGCQSLKDYTKLYVKSDCYQLAEAVFNLRGNIYDEFNIDLCHFLSLPMLSKDIMLKHTGVEMEVLSDLEMIQFFKSSIRGGLSFVNQRHFELSEAEKTLGEKMTLLYVDANNL